MTNLYNDLIQGKVKSLIVDYIPAVQKEKHYNYLFKHHQLREGVANEISELLIDSILFYAYSISEIEIQKLNLLGLREAAKYALSERLAKRQNTNSDGLVGELMLDILIQTNEPDAKKIFTRAKYTRFQDNSEITGYDAAYFLKKQDGRIELWLGQSKAGSLGYCEDGICKDLNSKYLDRYFSEAIRYMKDRGFDESPDCDLTELLVGINEIIFNALSDSQSIEERKLKIEDGIFALLSKKNVTVKVPCLIMFDSRIYENGTSFQDKMEELCNKIFSYFEKKAFDYTKKLQVSIVFLIFPVSQLKEIKKNITDIKKEVQ